MAWQAHRIRLALFIWLFTLAAGGPLTSNKYLEASPTITFVNGRSSSASLCADQSEKHNATTKRKTLNG